MAQRAPCRARRTRIASWVSSARWRHTPASPSEIPAARARPRRIARAATASKACAATRRATARVTFAPRPSARRSTAPALLRRRARLARPNALLSFATGRPPRVRTRAAWMLSVPREITAMGALASRRNSTARRALPRISARPVTAPTVCAATLRATVRATCARVRSARRRMAFARRQPKVWPGRQRVRLSCATARPASARRRVRSMATVRPRAIVSPTSANRRRRTAARARPRKSASPGSASTRFVATRRAPGTAWPAA